MFQQKGVISFLEHCIVRFVLYYKFSYTFQINDKQTESTL